MACYEKNLGSAGGNAIVTNSILSNSSNKPLFVDAKSTLQSAYCLTDFATDTSYPLNLQGNPEFTNPTFFDFQLQPNSLALNAGMENGAAIDLGTLFPQPSFEPNVMISQIFTNLENSNIPEFLTLYNPSNKTADLSGYAFTKGISAVIPEGVFLEGKEVLFLTKDASASIWVERKQAGCRMAKRQALQYRRIFATTRPLWNHNRSPEIPRGRTVARQALSRGNMYCK